jgi:hypothetical protein
MSLALRHRTARSHASLHPSRYRVATAERPSPTPSRPSTTRTMAPRPLAGGTTTQPTGHGDGAPGRLLTPAVAHRASARTVRSRGGRRSRHEEASTRHRRRWPRDQASIAPLARARRCRCRWQPSSRPAVRGSELLGLFRLRLLRPGARRSVRVRRKAHPGCQGVLMRTHRRRRRTDPRRPMLNGVGRAF